MHADTLLIRPVACTIGYLFVCLEPLWIIDSICLCCELLNQFSYFLGLPRSEIWIGFRITPKPNYLKQVQKMLIFQTASSEVAYIVREILCHVLIRRGSGFLWLCVSARQHPDIRAMVYCWITINIIGLSTRIDHLDMHAGAIRFSDGDVIGTLTRT